MVKIEIKAIPELPQSKTGEMDYVISEFLKLNQKFAIADGVKKYSVPYINKKAEKEKINIKAVTRSSKVYLINTKLA
jgi:hypothetical protein